MQVAPGKARRRRERAARDARVQRWAGDSGNAALMGRELPPAEVLAADQRITAWARQLKQAGLDGDMDVLRARAYLDLLLGKTHVPARKPARRPDEASGGGSRASSSRRRRARQRGVRRAAAGFAGKVTVTVPLTTLQAQADRPGEIPGIGPVDPRTGPRPGPRRRPEPQEHVVCDRDR